MKIILVVFILISFFFLRFFPGFGSSKKLVLAHNNPQGHPVHRGLVDFSTKLNDLSLGKYEVKVYPSEILGREREVLELIQVGALDFTKVSSSNLENFSPLWAVINLPYIFESTSHYFEVLDGEVGQTLLNVLQKNKMQGLAFYDAGARSFYASKPILSPQDIEGLKIRVMGSQSAIRMLKAMGGSPTPMPYGEVYTALQQNVIDGAENNVFALTTKKHGEVVKHYSLDEHAMMPDVLVMSAKLWHVLDLEERKWVKEAALYSQGQQRKYWAEEIYKEMQKIENELGMKVHHPKKAPFIKKVESLHQELASQGPKFRILIEKIKSLMNSAKDENL
ncbi:MAG: TRAP transporter substrate-binding protein DctP [Halobacteriovoraceae bacterium]|nr:TRAP transporter substrate-binding protein DctP [Halobacteriovoraceae bacterium]|tara:strand:+ start:24978 stop:25982 length:1005 start_codon:yes stop_codon:yes gene_type:complete